MDKVISNHAMDSGAIFSECNTYRYQLWRIWNHDKPKVLWLLHNPSVADGTLDDPTIRRCISFSKDWGYGGLYVGNLFPYKSTDPNLLRGKSLNVVAPYENVIHLSQMAAKCKLHILAHGNPIITSNSQLIDVPWHYLKLTKEGNPSHPLYLKADLKPMLFTI